MKKPQKDITGQKFNSLKALYVVEQKGKLWYWMFECDCGNLKSISASHVMHGHTKSCGCLQKKWASSEENTKRLNKELNKNLLSPEYLALQSRLKKEWCAVPENRQKMSEIGKSLVTDEWKAKMLTYNLGVKRTPEQIAKRVDSRKGYKHSQETLDKMSKSSTGKSHTDLSKDKMQIAKLGVSQSKEAIEKRRLSAIKNGKTKGEKHYNWKGGTKVLNKVIRQSYEGINYRTQAFIRDNRQCVWCGSTEQIEADHIIPLSALIAKYKITTLDEARAIPEFWDLTNLRTLCHSCHKQTPTYGVHAQ